MHPPVDRSRLVGTAPTGGTFRKNGKTAFIDRLRGFRFRSIYRGNEIE